MKILIAEDDQNTRDGLVAILEAEGYDTIAAADGKQALALFVTESPDMVCLDVMMPEVSGYDVCKEIRRGDGNVPVIFLTAKSEEIDKVLGLELGADDYIAKPFGVKEVVARIRAVTRRTMATRSSQDAPDSFAMGDLTIIPSELRAHRDKRTIDLGLRDIKILSLLYRNRGKVLKRDTIFNECWGLNYMPNSRSLDQHISQLRKKIERDHKHPCIIQTVHNAGYRYEA
ncbi:MAG: response regulator transcription factor [Verrucomicrobia bacterium]|jgi:DNA-binding response OmpR family regulator|nr:response regulator transcription factor [Verrucomicrobiota bacterium]MBT7066139.1 response regulator transcription factor [Verrucomicrobiota bacterium]MBT7698922.1 response regulator transcription factor [Verrucomicrobiota bacterium]